jgi:hypothetical protein
VTVSEVAQSRTTDRVQQELQAIADRHDGKLPASAVVDFARDPSTALHARFDWDDSEAAEKWRLEQARTIIARVKIDGEELGVIEGMPLVRARFGKLVGLPEQEPGTFFVVSLLVLALCPGRTDLVAPDTGDGRARGRVFRRDLRDHSPLSGGPV